MATQLKLNQLQQEGASTNNVIAWNGSTWAPASNGSGTVTSVAATQPSAGFTISGSPITSTGTLTFALSDDLAAVEGLSSNGIAVRTGTSTWNTRSIAVTTGADSSAALAIGNADGTGGNPTISISTDNATVKLSVEAATTANITLSGTQTIDSIALSSGQRCLVKNQTTGSENGIWVVSSGAWSRSTDYNTSAKAENGLIVFVQGGSTNGNKFFKVDQSKPTIGTTSLTFTEILGAADGNGIYSGSGTIGTAAVATVASGSTFTIDYNGGADALRVSDTASSTYIKSKDGSQGVTVDNSAVSLAAGSNSATLSATSFDVSTGIGGPYINADSTAINLSKSSVSMVLDASSIDFVAPYFAFGGHDATTAAEIRLFEPSTSGANYTAFKTQAQAANVTYTLPDAAPASTGYVLSSTTGGTLSWVANGGADGNGIYSGSGTIASGAVATITSGSSFTIDYNGGNNAISVSDSAGSITLGAKTASTGFIGIDSTGVGIYSGSDLFTLIEANGGAELNTDLRIYQGKLLLDSISTPAQFTANQNNFSLSATAAVLRVSTDASRNLTGIANSGTMQDGRVLTIINIGSFDLVLTTEDTNSTAANRFALGESNVTLKSNEAITLWYDTTTDRWRPIDYRASTAGTLDHGALTGLADDDHTQYALLAGRATGQILTGGTASGDDLTLRSTTNATKGDVILNDQGGNVIIGGAATASELRFMEPSGSGTEYTAFVAAAQAASQTYILPTDAPSNGEFLRWNTGGQLDWAAASGGSGDITNGGNTTGAAITIGTNDAFGLNFETAGVTRMSITGGASTGGAVTVTNVNANTNTVQDVLTLSANSSGTPLANYGTGILFQAKSATVDNRDIARISSYWTQPTDASREGALSFQLGDNAGALAEVMKLDRTTSTGLLSIGSTTPVTIGIGGITPGTSFTVGGNSQALTVGGAAGTISITTSSSSASAVLIDTSGSGSSIRLGSNSFNQTSGSQTPVTFASGFAPTSGTATFTNALFTGTLNQTGGASGISRGIYLNHTLTAVADYRALEISANSANSKAIYQTGSTATNNIVGRTSFGTTSTPHASATIDIVTTSLGLGLPAMTSTQRDAISSPRQGLAVYNTTDDKISIRRTSDWVNVASDRTTINAQTGTTYTLVIGDDGKMVTMDNASAMTLTVPTNASVAFPIGTNIDVVRKGAGSLTLTSSATIRSADGYTKLRVQYSSATLTKIATDEWLLIGDLSA